MQTCALVQKFKKWTSVKNSKSYMESIKTNFQRANNLAAGLSVLSLELL